MYLASTATSGTVSCSSKTVQTEGRPTGESPEKSRENGQLSQIKTRKIERIWVAQSKEEKAN